MAGAPDGQQYSEQEQQHMVSAVQSLVQQQFTHFQQQQRNFMSDKQLIATTRDCARNKVWRSVKFVTKAESMVADGPIARAVRRRIDPHGLWSENQWTKYWNTTGSTEVYKALNSKKSTCTSAMRRAYKGMYPRNHHASSLVEFFFFSC